MDVLSSPNPNDYQLNVALKEALATGDKALAHTIVERLLLSTSADLSAPATEALMSVLDMSSHVHHAVDVELVQRLLEAGASVLAPYRGASSPLYLALVSGNVEAAAMVLDAGADIHASQRNPYHYLSDLKSMLVWAIESSQTSAALRMIEAGVDPHGLPEWPRPLQAAARHGNLEVAQALISLGVDVNAKHPNSIKPVNSSGDYKPSETALMEASKKDGNPVLQLLLDHGADVKAQSDERWTALHFTIWAEPSGPTFAPKNVQLLLKSGATPNIESSAGETLMTRALRHLVTYGEVSHSEVVCQILGSLLVHGADPNQNTPYGESPLNMAVARGDIKSVLMLLDAGAKIRDLVTPLWLMALEGDGAEHKSLTSFLKQHGLRLDLQQLPALFEQAVANGELKRVRLLIENGVDVKSSSGGMALLDAAEFGFADIVEALIEAGANPNVIDSGSNCTVLMLVLNHERNRGGSNIHRHYLPIGEELTARAIEQDLKIVRILLKAGTNLRVVSSDGYTALHMAALTASPAVLQALLEAGADVNARSNQGRTPLLTITGGGRRKKLLENFPFHIDNRSEELRLATQRDEEAVRLLIAAGANVTAEGKDGFNVLSLAALYGTPTTVQILIEAGAATNALVGGWPMPSLVLSLGRTAVLLKQHGFGMECFKWLEDDLKKSAQGEMELNEITKNARPQLVHALEEDVKTLKLLIQKWN